MKKLYKLFQSVIISNKKSIQFVQTKWQTAQLIFPSANHAAHSGKTLRTVQTVLPGQPTQTKLH